MLFMSIVVSVEHGYAWEYIFPLNDIEIREKCSNKKDTQKSRMVLLNHKFFLETYYKIFIF